MRVHRPLIPLLALLMLALCLPARAALLPWSALRGAEVRFVTGATAGPNDDARVCAYLEAHGLRVRTVGAHAPVGNLTDVRLVIISSTASPEVLGDKYLIGVKFTSMDSDSTRALRGCLDSLQAGMA